MSPSTRYPLLFAPLALGPVRVENRIVFCAHLTNYARDGMPTAQHAAYYAARAAGGAGLIITEEHSVHPTDWAYEKLVHGFDPAVVARYREVTEAVHRYGTPIFAQINHNGGQGTSMYSRLPLWAPSPVADPLFREVPKAVERHEIDEIVASYALVARHCREGGFDGVELQCSHSSIVRAFLSPTANRRTDDYGGPLERRARLLMEIVAAVRASLGTDLALGVRLCGDELTDGGTTVEDAVAVARMLADQGAVDYLNTSIGVATQTLYLIEASMHVPPGYATYIPSAIREAVEPSGIPVVGVGRFKDPVQAERALEDGICDLVGMVRAQIADPDLAAKARTGHAEDIRLCLSCNQECVGRMGLNRWLGCIENPRTGREAEPRAPRTALARDVLVVGAGPGGLQSAIAAAHRGHRVTVLEREDEPGGALRVAATVPSRAELGDLVRNQLAECRALGVRIELGTDADLRTIAERAPDAVVLATGSVPRTPPWAAGAEGTPGTPRVCHAVDVAAGRAHPQGRVLVVDEVGFHDATSVAELLAERGCQVEIATPALVVGQDLSITLDFETFQMRAAKLDVTLSSDLVVTALGDGSVELLHHPTGTGATRRVDWVVLALPHTADDTLYRALRASATPGTAMSVARVGDCLAPRRAHSAVIEGDRVGAAL